MSAFTLSANTTHLASGVALRGTALRAATKTTRAHDGGRPGVVTTRAFFGGFGKKAAAGTPYVCIDCGYVYRGQQGEFKDLPRDYKCPTCNVGKNRFKVYREPAAAGPSGGGNSAYAAMAEQKAANRAAMAAKKKKGGKSPREIAREKMIAAQEEKDAKRGGGFFGR
ncbi:uncharacterized protein MICPUCDRAFT_38800 [Micromonas pusilla CCMP1545]|jgi:rubredoxin|uniref:Predicted protein n=2 Tax=Micromonas pusilla TaxID=38833 RepID=C1MM22_MICPC|nr:uncharacterized protein MICPUCDRAFT_38800 [Micromonas pusilla CCMP1545]EEH58964.1 predicted protein [Micromonas pusilla CCMP1545]|mmetsp:Transcript_2545/g.8152  ORF Transcript_2545/g.8152 Transcript_2545/m.8152 type:complete len:167 (+) Transcript_2545:188-688(+)|eukprot:XP_003057319.1 predicted protein [Micromonas pusilla CCMP1545]